MKAEKITSCSKTAVKKLTAASTVKNPETHINFVLYRQNIQSTHKYFVVQYKKVSK